MTIWIAKPKLWLPGRLQRLQESEQQDRAWRRRFLIAAVMALSVICLNSGALYLSRHHHGNWAFSLMTMASLPMIWLFDKAVFLNPPSIQPPELVDIPELIELP